MRPVEALALYSPYSQLSPSLTEAQITKVLKSASPIANCSQEYALDGLRTLLMGKSVVDGAPISFDGPGARKSLCPD